MGGSSSSDEGATIPRPVPTGRPQQRFRPAARAFVRPPGPVRSIVGESSPRNAIGALPAVSRRAAGDAHSCLARLASRVRGAGPGRRAFRPSGLRIRAGDRPGNHPKTAGGMTSRLTSPVRRVPYYPGRNDPRVGRAFPPEVEALSGGKARPTFLSVRSPCARHKARGGSMKTRLVPCATLFGGCGGSPGADSRGQRAFWPSSPRIGRRLAGISRARGGGIDPTLKPGAGPRPCPAHRAGSRGIPPAGLRRGEGTRGLQAATARRRRRIRPMTTSGRGMLVSIRTMLVGSGTDWAVSWVATENWSWPAVSLMVAELSSS